MNGRIEALPEQRSMSVGIRADFHCWVWANEQPAMRSMALDWVDRLLANLCQDDSVLPADHWLETPISAPDRSIEPTPAVLAYHAPLGLLEGAWLQAVALAGNGHRASVAALFAGYLTLLGQDESLAPAFSYRAALARAGIALPRVDAESFAWDERVGEPALAFAALQLALGLLAPSHFPEILGFTFAYTRSDSPWRLPALPCERRAALLGELDACARRSLAALWNETADGRSRIKGRFAIGRSRLKRRFAIGTDTLLERVQAGWSLYRAAEAEYRLALHEFEARTPSLAERVGTLFARKAPYARGYHGGIELGGRRLDDWFGEHPFDAQGFLAALAASPYLVGKPGSRPFDRLTEFGGPMFGIFDAQELALISAWQAEMEAKPPTTEGSDAQSPTATHSAPHTLRSPNPPLAEQMSVLSFLAAGKGPTKGPFTIEIAGIQKPGMASLLRPRDLDPDTPCRGDDEALLASRKPSLAEHGPRLDSRVLFHRLVNARHDASTFEQARRWVERHLAKARGWTTRGRDVPFAYSAQGLSEWAMCQHADAVARYQPLAGKPRLSRDDYLFGMLQFAPAILVDGCWLQYTGQAAWQDERLWRLLYRIYADELGAGRVERNHPNVYRALLDAAGMRLPAFYSLEFARHPDFFDTAFDLPAYLLAIALFPRRYLPELLGLNLAIELSGLGGQYLRLAEELRHWGLDPLIVTLHQSIDTLAGGHAALAVEAIQLYLDQVDSTCGEPAVTGQWQRIWCGYRSLEAATRRFKWALLLAYGRRRLAASLLRLKRHMSLVPKKA